MPSGLWAEMRAEGEHCLSLPDVLRLCLARKLISISFGDLNPFPLRQIRNRRAYHLEKVRLELTELEAIREDFLRERDTSPDKGELVSDEEEDT